MTTVLRIILFFPFLLLWPLLAKADSSRHEVTEELSGEFHPNASVHIKNINGRIILKTWDLDSYEVIATKRSRHEENLDLIEVRRDITADRMSIEVHIPKKKGWFSFSQIQGSVNLVVTVPATVDLERIRTVNGTVELAGFANEVNASSVNGRIEARELGGSTHLDTVNGSIEASFASLTDSDELSFSSVNGGIRLRFPHDLNADLRTSVVNGRISCDFPITLADGSSTRRLKGRIGDGGALLKASTVNGSISVREK